MSLSENIPPPKLSPLTDSNIPTPPTTDSNVRDTNASATVSFKRFDSKKSLELPLSIDSSEALEWCGYLPHIASDLYNVWSNPGTRLRGDRRSLLDFATDHVERLRKPFFEQLNREQQLIMLGVNEDTIDAILDIEYQDICGTQSLLFWVQDTLKTNYFVLQRHCLAMDKYDETWKGRENQDTKSEVSKIPYGEFPLNREHVSIEDMRPSLEGHVELWLGNSPYSSSQGGKMAELILNDGSINMHALETLEANGDFNKSRSGYYFTPDRQLAERYRQYAAIRCPYAETWLLRILIPTTFIEQLSSHTFEYDEAFQKIVWKCRNRGYLPMPEIPEWQAQMQLIRGCVCTTIPASMCDAWDARENNFLDEADVVYVSKEEKDEQVLGKSLRGNAEADCFSFFDSSTLDESIKNIETWIRGVDIAQEPERAAQWAFLNGTDGSDEIGSRLSKELRGKIHIEVVAAMLALDEKEDKAYFG